MIANNTSTSSLCHLIDSQTGMAKTQALHLSLPQQQCTSGGASAHRAALRAGSLFFLFFLFCFCHIVIIEFVHCNFIHVPLCLTIGTPQSWRAIVDPYVAENVLAGPRALTLCFNLFSSSVCTCCHREVVRSIQCV